MQICAFHHALRSLEDKRLVTKTLLVMKMTMILLLAGALQLSARGVGQTVTYSAKSVELETVFSIIKEQTGYMFFYDRQDIDLTKKVSVQWKNIDLESALRQLLDGKSLRYEILRNTVLITKRQHQAADLSPRPFLETIAPPVTGIVRGPDGQPIAGANIIVKGTKRGTTSNAEGSFSINANNGDILIISSIGYADRSITINNNSIGVVSLNVSESKLDEVQIIAYGETSKRLQTGNVSSVKAEDIAKQPVNNPLLALAGRVPGVQITQANGISGGGIKVQIQGQNSLLYGNDPFYVIDGVPYTAQLLTNLGSILGSSSTGGPYAANGSPLSLLNPSDIESIEILKDASATAIYGSRAANGAILITTKKGKAGRIKVDLNVQTGIGQVAKKLDLLNTQQYLEMRKEAYENDGVPIPNSSTPQDASNYDLTLWDQNKYTDWQHELIGSTAKYNDAQVTISGGNAFTQYLVGGGYHKETTVFPGDFNDQKMSLHFNINSTSENQRFHFMLSGNYLVDNNKLLQADLTDFAVRLAPNSPNVYNSDGTLNWAADENGSSSYQFNQPLSYTINKYNNKSYNLTSSVNLSYELFKGFQIKSSFGYTSLQSDETQYQLPSSAPPEYVQFVPRKAIYGHNNLRSWILEPQITYNTKIEKGQLSVLVGSTFQQKQSNRKVLEATGFDNDLSLDNIGAASSVTVPGASTIATIYKYNALFGRLNYNWEEKYIIDLTIRRDGSSRFGSENLFHNFGAVGAAWLFSNEDFIKNSNFILSFGKVKASYGTSGNDQIGDYSFISLYDPNNQPVPYRGGTALQPRNLANPYLQWEETRKLNIGLDLGLLKNRILFSANYFYNRSSNQLLQTALSATTGPASISTNLAATVQNTGLEISLGTINISKESFTWSTNMNLTIPRNKLVFFQDLEASSFYKNSYLIGQPVNIIRTYNYSGVNAETGLYEFIDKNGKISSDNPTGDIANRTVIINPNQRFYGGISNTFSYKGFQLDILFQFVKQQGRSYKYGASPAGFFIANQPISVLNRWQQNGDQSKTNQRYSATNYDLLTLDDYLTTTQASFGDASYIRLKNLSFSWQIPKKWIDQVKLQQCRLFVHGQNLLTFTNYIGLDPETLNSSMLPPLRVITFGINATL